MAKKHEDSGFQIWMSYREYRTGGDSKNLYETYSDRTDIHVFFSPNAFHLNSPKTFDKWCILNLEWDPKTYEDLYCVISRYKDGDIFGISYGNWCLESICRTSEEANSIQKAIENAKYHGGYKPWEGYFSRLEYVDVVVLKVTS
jgi:hypothetical protein